MSKNKLWRVLWEVYSFCYFLGPLKHLIAKATDAMCSSSRLGCSHRAGPPCLLFRLSLVSFLPASLFFSSTSGRLTCHGFCTCGILPLDRKVEEAVTGYEPA